MNFRSKIFILFGVYALIALYFVRKLIYLYHHGLESVNLLPIGLFEILLFSIAVLVFILTLISISILVKRNKHPMTFKKRFNFLIPSFIGFIIVFLLLDRNHSDLIVPVSISIYGLVLLNLNRYVSSKLLYFSLLLLLLGIISFFMPSFKWWFLSFAFGLMPIAFGVILRIKG